MSGKRKSGSLDDMCGIIWQIIFIMLNIYTSSWVLQLSIIFPLCSTLCMETHGKMILWRLFQGLHTPLSASCLETRETRLNELRSPLDLSNAPLLRQCSWRPPGLTISQGQHLVCIFPRQYASGFLWLTNGLWTWLGRKMCNIKVLMELFLNDVEY